MQETRTNARAIGTKHQFLNPNSLRLSKANGSVRKSKAAKHNPLSHRETQVLGRYSMSGRSSRRRSARKSSSPRTISNREIVVLSRRWRLSHVELYILPSVPFTSSYQPLHVHRYEIEYQSCAPMYFVIEAGLSIGGTTRARRFPWSSFWGLESLYAFRPRDEMLNLILSVWHHWQERKPRILPRELTCLQEHR